MLGVLSESDLCVHNDISLMHSGTVYVYCVTPNEQNVDCLSVCLSVVAAEAPSSFLQSAVPVVVAAD